MVVFVLHRQHIRIAILIYVVPYVVVVDFIGKQANGDYLLEVSVRDGTINRGSRYSRF